MLQEEDSAIGSRFRNPLRRARSGIPHVTLQGRHRERTLDPTGYGTQIVFTPFTLRLSTVQPSTGQDLLVLSEGLRDKEVYHVFTDTNAMPAIEGSTNLGDQVFIPSRYAADEGWFTVIKRKAWQNGIINHYDLLVVRENEN